MKKHAQAPKSPFISPRWIKATVIYRGVYHLQAGLGLAAKLQLENHAQLCYFARYTTPPFRLEIQMLTGSSLAALRKFIMAYKSQNVAPLAVNFEKCNGSPAHACACQTVMTMAGMSQLTAGMMADVVHWMCNMAGFSYVQEAGILAMQAHVALRNVPGYIDAPIFGPPKLGHRVAKTDEHKHSKVRRALRRSTARTSHR